MNQADVNPVLTGHEVRELKLLIEQRSGILFDESRERFLTTRVVEHMQGRRLNFGMELLRLVRVSNVEYDSLLERLLTQETSFLRYPALFAAFQQHVLPELQERKFWDKDSALRIWSAGCASGEEPYSIALCICDAATLGAVPPTSVLATDVSREALDRAGRAVYSRRALENLTPSQIATYFTRTGLTHTGATPGFAPAGDGYQVKPVLRGMVTFAPMNLAQPVYLGRFDCIFCMNVLIYFGEELRSQLIQRFYEALEPGGYLFLGHAESVANAPVKFHQRFTNGARLLQKPLQQQACQARAAGDAS